MIYEDQKQVEKRTGVFSVKLCDKCIFGDDPTDSKNANYAEIIFAEFIFLFLLQIRKKLFPLGNSQNLFLYASFCSMQRS